MEAKKKMNNAKNTNMNEFKFEVKSKAYKINYKKCVMFIVSVIEFCNYESL